MPYRIKQSLATANFMDTKAVSQALAQFDVIQKDNPRYDNNNIEQNQEVRVRYMTSDRGRHSGFRGGVRRGRGYNNNTQLSGPSAQYTQYNNN